LGQKNRTGTTKSAFWGLSVFPLYNSTIILDPHTISANGRATAPATRLILSLLISPAGSRMSLPNSVFFMLSSYDFWVPHLIKLKYEDMREEIRSSATPLYFSLLCPSGKQLCGFMLSFAFQKFF
jgi:hypothetical protein